MGQAVALSRTARFGIVARAPGFPQPLCYVRAMDHSHPLLARIVAAPEDIEPRRAYAEAVRGTDPERAELIDLQLGIRAALRNGTEP